MYGTGTFFENRSVILNPKISKLFVNKRSRKYVKNNAWQRNMLKIRKEFLVVINFISDTHSNNIPMYSANVFQKRTKSSLRNDRR